MVVYRLAINKDPAVWVWNPWFSRTSCFPTTLEISQNLPEKKGYHFLWFVKCDPIQLNSVYNFVETGIAELSVSL